MYFTDGSPMVNSHCGLVPSITNSLYSDVPHHEGSHVVQMSGHDGSDVTVDNLVTLSPTESGAHEHSGKWINSLEYGFIERVSYTPITCNCGEN